MTRSCCWRRNAPAIRRLRAALAPLLGRIDIADDARGQFARRRRRWRVLAADAVARWLWEKIGKYEEKLTLPLRQIETGQHRDQSRRLQRGRRLTN